MSAVVVFDEYGGPEALHVIDAPVPQPGPGQVRVAVRAAGVQPAGAMLRSGRLRIEIQARYPLEEAAQAHRDVETRHVRGKVVLLP